jgi:molecular chaperone GrpE
MSENHDAKPQHASQEAEDMSDKEMVDAPAPEENDAVGGEATDAADAAEAAPADPVAALEAEVADLKDKLLRTFAEMENLRKRAERDAREGQVYAIEKFARDLLSVSDNFSRALETVTEEAMAEMSEKGRALFTGVEMTQKELHTVFSRHGVVPVAAEPGDAFDPNLHQAVSTIPSEQPKGTIAQCFAPGWKIGDRVLRAAMVTVSAGSAN